MTDQETHPTFPCLEPYHVEIGNNNSRPDRTTTATRMLREVKASVKTLHPKKRKEERNQIAKTWFEERLILTFPEVPPRERGKVFVKTTGSTKIRRQPIATHGMRGDKTAQFAEALDRDAALDHFLHSRDSPTLAREINKHRNKIESWRSASSEGRPSPDMEKVAEFEERLNFWEEQNTMVERGDKHAKMFVRNANPIKALQGNARELENPTPIVEETALPDIPVDPQPLLDLDNNPEGTVRLQWTDD